MKLKPNTTCASAAALLAGLILVPDFSQAAQMAYEGFDYSTGSGNLTGFNGGSGWNGAWQTVNNGSADVVASSLAAGVSSPAGYDLRSIGNSSNLPNNRRVGRLLNTSTNGPFGSRGYRDANGRIGADGTTLYLSFMQQSNGAGAYYEFEFHRDNLGDPGRIGGIGNDTGTNNVNLRAPNGTQTTIGAGNTAVNFYVVRIDFKNGNDDVYVYQNPTSATDPGIAPGGPTLIRTAAADMSFNGISFGAFNNGRTVAHDELRFGQSWSDVIVPSLAQPVFVSQPRASVTAFTGGSVGFTAVANGYPEPAYQWFKGATPLAGQTSTTLTLSNVQASDAGAYHLTATNSQGAATTGDATVVVLSTPAGLLAYEGFDYNTGTSNMNGNAGGLGWGAAWTAVDGGGGNVQSGNLAAGTNGPNGYDAQSAANSSFIPNAKRDGRLLDTTPGGRLGAAGYIDSNGNVGVDGKTLYLSFLQQPDGTSLFYEFEFHRGNLGDPGRIGGVGNDTNNPTVGLRTGGTTTLVGPGSTGVNLYVVRIDFKAGNDDVRVYQNPISATEPGVPTLTKLNASDMSFNGLSLAAFVNGRTVKHDEIRLGQSWSDVIFGTSRRQLTWIGDGVSNNWNFATANWNDGVGATQFADGDPVTFDDSGSDTPAVNIATAVSTASLTATNNTKNYMLGGAGAINCSGGLAKSGNGSLTFTGSSNFSSAAVVTGGTLALNGTTSVGGGLNANAGITTLGGTNSIAGIIATNGNIDITGPTTITSSGAFVFVGNLPLANSSLTIGSGGSLTMNGGLADSWVVGRDGGSGSVTQNGGTVTYNPPNRPDAFIGASTSSATVASYTMNGGTLEMSAKRLSLALGPVTSHLTQTGGTINLNQLHLGTALPGGPGTGIYDLTGGVMNVGTAGITSTTGLYTINLGGGTIGAAADWGSSLGMTLTGTGGTTAFDTAGHKITLAGQVTGDGGLVKAGLGTLVMNGFNDYIGSTNVMAGTLAGTGSASTALTVASGAAISPGDLTLGIFSCDHATLSSGSTFAVKIDSSSDFSDQLTSAGNITITGASLSFTEVGSGTMPVGTVLVIVEASSITGTFTGYPQSTEITVGGNTYTIQYGSGQVSLTLIRSNPYVAWASEKGLDGTPGKNPAFTADPDNDGTANGLEWILGGNPLGQDAPLVAAAGSATAGLTLSFTREEASLGNATLVLQWDADLVGPWTDVPVTQTGGSYANGVTVTVDEFATPDAVTVHIPASNAAGGKVFGRLRGVNP